MKLYPQKGSSSWSGIARWLPQWFYPQEETFKYPSTGNSLTLTKINVSTPLDADYLHTPDSYTLDNRDILFNAFSQEIHIHRFSAYLKSKSVGFSPTNVGYPPFYIIPKSFDTLQIETDEGWVTLNKIESLSQALTEPYAGYVEENGTTIVVNVGVKSVTPSTVANWDYITNTDRNPYLPVYLITSGGKWIITPDQIGSDGLLPIREVDKVYYYLYTDLPTISFKLDSEELDLSPYDPTDSSDHLSFIYNLPYDSLLKTIPRNTNVVKYFRNQTKLQLEGLLSLVFNTYETVDLTFGDTPPTKFIPNNTRYYTATTPFVYGHSIDKYINYHVVRKDGTITKSLTDPLGEKIYYLVDPFLGDYEANDTEVLVPEITTTTLGVEMEEFNWIIGPINTRPKASEFI